VSITGTVAAEDRRRALVDLLRARGSVDLTTAAEALSVHQMTIRRDLDHLEREGTVRRVRGGAVLVESADFEQRQGRHLPAKRKIAEKLLPLLPRRSAISLDASTTIHQFAEMITAADDLTVVTNGLASFEALRNCSGVRSFLTGGEAEQQNASLVGSLAVTAVSTFVFARSFMSTTSVDPVIGTTEPTTAEVDVKRAMAQAAAHVVLAVDSSKLGTQSVVRALEMSRIDLLVTELPTGDHRLDAYRDTVEVL
jgi:DeoR/GlpR family transcriptional regulator of sugar metabolism